jgi:molecular chaperone DnaK
VELTLELDRGGRLSARALVPALGQVFEQVAHLLVPDAAPEALEQNLAALRERLAALRADAFRRSDSKRIAALGDVEQTLGEALGDIAAARGGDADAGQKARRLLLEVDARIEQAELDGRWPELEERARERLAAASSWVAELGTPEEQRLLAETAQAVERARKSRNARELQRQLRVVTNLANAAYYRDPQAWEWELERAASQSSSASDLVRAEALVREGRRALERGDRAAVRDAVQQLWRLLPDDPQARRLGHDSGVR